MENLTCPPAAERLLAELHAAGLEVTDDGEGGLHVEGDETAFTRYRETIRAHKAALLEHFDMVAAWRLAETLQGKGVINCGPCPRLRAREGVLWCRIPTAGGHRLIRLEALQGCPAAAAARLPSFCAGIRCRWYEARWNQCRWRSRDGRNWINAPPQGLRSCPERAA